MSNNLFYSKSADRTKPWCVYVVVCSVPGIPPFYIGKTRVKTMENQEKPYHGSVASELWSKKWHSAVKTSPEKFRRKIVATFETEAEALLHEEELLRHFTAHKSYLFVNMSIGGKKFSGGCWKGRELSETHRKKIGKSNKGKIFTIEAKKKMSDSKKGIPRIFSKEQKLNISKSRRKQQKDKGLRFVKSPEGTTFSFYVLKDFCQEHDLNKSCMNSVLTGNRPHHKGWSLCGNT